MFHLDFHQLLLVSLLFLCQCRIDAGLRRILLIRNDRSHFLLRRGARIKQIRQNILGIQLREALECIRLQKAKVGVHIFLCGRRKGLLCRRFQILNCRPERSDGRVHLAQFLHVHSVATVLHQLLALCNDAVQLTSLLVNLELDQGIFQLPIDPRSQLDLPAFLDVGIVGRGGQQARPLCRSALPFHVGPRLLLGRRLVNLALQDGCLLLSGALHFH
mmetsp:Transcript_32942/g.70139  ORF Transcript_32942/g.70139 Transcript_32942/m.70139 type:complete len:217 (-) Transcript_32942:2707-3357(-)